MTPIHAGSHGDHSDGSLPYQFYVRYSYDVGGHRYWGDWKSRIGSSIEEARTRSGIVEGGSITVYCSPKNPKLSVVEKGWTIERLILPIMGVALVVLPAAFCWALLLIK